MKTLLAIRKTDNITITQAVTLLDTILRQNYLKPNTKFYQPQKGVSMELPILGLIAGIFLQIYEQQLIKIS
jgi:hypothetical protein